MKRLGTKAEEAVFVGDNPEVDISGARGAGMRTVWRRDRAVSRTVEADAVIETLGDLVPLLNLDGNGTIDS